MWMFLSDGPFRIYVANVVLYSCYLVTDLSEFLRHIVSLKYNERPDYNRCRTLFTKALKSVGAKPSDKLDFGPPPVIKSTPKVILQLCTRYVLYTVCHYYCCEIEYILSN